MKLIKGSDVAAAIDEKVIAQIEKLKQSGLRPPRLAMIRVGERPEDITYERNAVKRLEKVGIEYGIHHYPVDVEKEVFLREFDQINQDPENDGLLIMRPLPAHLENIGVGLRIDPERDVDGISPLNQARILQNLQEGFAPCTPEAVLEMLDFAGVELAGKRVTIVGNGKVVGRPLSLMMLDQQAAVTVCNSKTEDLQEACQRTDILVSATGQAKIIKSEYIKEGAVLIDVGISVNENGHLCGDMDFEGISAENKADMATTVPGGIGVVTNSVLARHVLQARLKKENKQDK